MSITVSRPDLAWALTAVLPHVGSKSRQLDWVGFDSGVEGGLSVYATDSYTVGVATIDCSQPLTFRLAPAEAKDLLRFVRPTKVGHQEDLIELLVTDTELHIALHGHPRSDTGAPESDGSINPPETEVYELSEPTSVTFDDVYQLVEKVKTGDRDGVALDLQFKPDTFARFAKAARFETDRLVIEPKAGRRYGAAYIEVGDNFEGAIAGLTYEMEKAS